MYVKSSMSTSEVFWYEGDMYARGMHVAMEDQSYSTGTHEIEVSIKKKMRSALHLQKEELQTQILSTRRKETI